MIPRISAILSIVSITCLAVPTAFSMSGAADDIDRYMKPIARAGQFSGVVLASQNGKIVYEQAFGKASVELNVENRTDTKFNIASITKAYTKVIAIKLILDKRLGVQDKLSKFVPDFPRGDEITVEMLLRHRSGLPHEILREGEESLSFTTAEFVERAKTAKLLFEPGKGNKYSGTGYTVLARVLEIASGKSFSQLLNEIVFTPAGMTASVEPDGIQAIAGRAQDYYLERDRVIPADLRNYTSLAGAGSVFSTARDVHSFGIALLSGKYSDSVKLSIANKDVFADNGNTNGYRANTRIDNGKGYGFVVVSNLVSGANDVIIRDLQAILEGRKVSSPSVPSITLAADQNANLSDYVGRYESSGGGGFTVLQKQGVLYAGKYHLYPIGKDTFYSYGHWAEIKFNRNSNGNVINSDWTSPVWKNSWTKKPQAVNDVAGN